jgi:hypothetical protein
MSVGQISTGLLSPKPERLVGLAVEPPVFFRRAAGQLALMNRTAPSPPIESIPKTCMTGTSKQDPRRRRGAGRRSHGAEPHFEPSMQAI